MKAFVIFALASLIAACASTASIKKESYGPSGKKSYEISCNGLGSTLSPCYSKAGEVCKSSGYNVIKQYDDAPFFNLIVECKE